MADFDITKVAALATQLGLTNVKQSDMRLLAKLAGATQEEETKPLFNPAEAEKLILARWRTLPYFDVLTGEERIDLQNVRGIGEVADSLYFDAQAACSGSRGAEAVTKAISVIASAMPRNRWLEAIPVWDGRDRFCHLQAKLGITDNEREALRDWLQALVGMQVFRKELEYNMTQWRPPMLILYGGQGGGKNWLLKQLCLGVSGAYNEKVHWEQIIAENRDAVRRLKRCIIASFDENPTGIGRETYDVKAWITTTHCLTRKMHGTYDDHDKVICSGFAGTSNFKNMLTDISGSRRFVVLDLTNKKKIPSFDFPQLLAQVFATIPASMQKHSVPWKVPVVGQEAAQFNATFNAFDAGIFDAFEKCAGLTTLANIIDHLDNAEARQYYLRDPFRLPRRLGELFDYDGEMYQERK